jgi:drug/metabolite transporter (DMT)-like permease
MLNYRTLLFGLILGSIDAIVLPITKAVHNGLNPWAMLIPVVVYASTPLIFLTGLASETLSIMNLVWDLTSTVIITLIGVFFFREQLPPLKLLGVFFSFIALFFMTYEGNGWNDWLLMKYNSVMKSLTF